MSDITLVKKQAALKVVPLFIKPTSESASEGLAELRRILIESEPAPQVANTELAIANAEEFYDRFGLNWKNEEDRSALFELKKRYSLNDRAIRMFFMTGNLKKTKNGVVLAADPGYAFVIGVMSGAAGLFTILFLMLTGWAYYRGNLTSGIGLIYSLFLATLSGLGIWSSVGPAIFQHRVINRATEDE